MRSMHTSVCHVTRIMRFILRAGVLCALAASCAAEEEEPAAVEAAPVIEIPSSVDGAFFFEPFLVDWEDKWKISKDADFNGRWKHEPHSMDGIPGDLGLVVGDPARKHAVSTIFTDPVVSETHGFVVQC